MVEAPAIPELTKTAMIFDGKNNAERLEAATRVLTGMGFQVTHFDGNGSTDALTHIGKAHPNLVVSDLMEGNIWPNGKNILKAAQQQGAATILYAKEPLNSGYTEFSTRGKFDEKAFAALVAKVADINVAATPKKHR